MSDDYLWDRSGEPDPEIARLESTLGKLRHQPKALVLPAVARPRRSFFPALAAAAVVLLVLASGLWLALQRSIDEETNSPRLSIARPVPYLLAGMKEPALPASPALAASPDGEQTELLSSSQPARKGTPRRVVKERQGISYPVVARQGPNRRDDRALREGEMAKEKLMLALRFASSKLNLVQKKVQVNKENGPTS